MLYVIHRIILQNLYLILKTFRDSMTITVSDSFGNLQELYKELEDILVFNEVLLLKMAAIQQKNVRLLNERANTPSRKRKRSTSEPRRESSQPNLMRQISRTRLFSD